MNDRYRINQQLEEENISLRKRIRELEQLEEARRRTETLCDPPLLDLRVFAKAFMHIALPAGITTLSEGRYIDVNEAFLRFTGQKREDIIGLTVVESGMLTAAQRAQFVTELITKDRAENVEMDVRLKDGQLRRGLFNSIIMPFSDGQKCMLTVMADITDRKLMEKMLRESEACYRELFNNIRSGVAIYDVIDGGRDFIFKDFNRAGELLEGDRKEDLVGRSIFDVRPGSEDFKLPEVFRRVCATGKPERFPTAIYKDGRLSRWYENFIYRLPSGEIVTVFDDVTEDKLMEHALLESEKKYRTILDNTNDAIYVHDFEGNISEVNDIACKMTGYERHELVGANLIKLDPQWGAPPAVHGDLNLLMKEKSAVFERTNFCKDGKKITVEVSVKIMSHAGKGKVAGFVRDITERKKMEESLRLSDEMMTNISEGIILTKASNGTIIYANQNFEKMFGYGHGELIGKDISIVNAPAGSSPEAVAKEIQAILKDNGVWRGEICNVMKDGSAFWCAASVSTFNHSAHGEVWVSAHTDITDRKRALEAIREREEQYRFLIANTIDVVCHYSLDGLLLFGSDALAAVTGYSPEEVVGTSGFDLIHPDDRPALLETIRKGIETGSSHTVEYRTVCKDGRYKWIEMSGKAIRNNRTGEDEIVAVARDVDKRKRAEDALKESEARFRAVFEGSNDAITVVSGTGIMYDCNTRALEMFGFESREEFLATPSVARSVEIQPDGRDSYTAAMDCVAKVRQKGHCHIEWVYRRKNGEAFYAELQLMGFDYGGIPAILATARDISDRKRMEADLKKNMEELEMRVKERTFELQEMNMALRVLLRNSDDDKKALAESIQVEHRSARHSLFK